MKEIKETKFVKLITNELRETYKNNLSFIGSLKLRRVYFAFETENSFLLISEKFLEERVDKWKFIHHYHKDIVFLFINFLIHFLHKLKKDSFLIREIEATIKLSNTNLVNIIKSKYSDYNEGSGYKFHYVIQDLVVLSTIIKKGKAYKLGKSFYFSIET
ncbi:hypothetical protein [Thermococcus sp.]|uniref:hypothetical protein n=1 Tax=Thermococcus sp. TaxID=35749 RepID=UPI00261EFCAA|nr:hypothetical protein [Thermococcus sp.]